MRGQDKVPPLMIGASARGHVDVVDRLIAAQCNIACRTEVRNAGGGDLRGAMWGLGARGGGGSFDRCGMRREREDHTCARPHCVRAVLFCRDSDASSITAQWGLYRVSLCRRQWASFDTRGRGSPEGWRKGLKELNRGRGRRETEALGSWLRRSGRAGW
eukprot:1678415-Rhodomonas_salina.2